MDKNKQIVYIRTSNIYTDSRATKEIKSLSENGYHVCVIAWDKKGNAIQKCNDIFSGHDVEFEFFNFRVSKGIGDNKIKGIVYLICFFMFALGIMLKKRKDIEYIHACDLDGGIPAYIFCRNRNIKLIYDIYDYYIDSHSIPGKLKHRVEQFEISIINKADTVIICNEERRQQIYKSNPKKLCVIHNSPEITEIDINEQEIYDFAYCGALIDNRLIKEILEQYPEHSNFKIIIAGEGKYEDMCMKLDNKYPNFKYMGPVSYSEVLEIENKSKVMSAIYKPSLRNHKLCAPNKFYEAMGLGKAIIVCKGTGIDKIVEREKIGLVIPYESDKFYKGLSNLINNNNDRISMRENSVRIFKEKYEWPIMEKRLLKAYSET